MTLRPIKYKKWIPAIYLDGNDIEHKNWFDADKATPMIQPIKVDNTETWTDFVNDGLFHKFSIKGNVQDGIETIAVIELPDGSVMTTSAINIKFENEP